MIGPFLIGYLVLIEKLYKKKKTENRLTAMNTLCIEGPICVGKSTLLGWIRSHHLSLFGDCKFYAYEENVKAWQDWKTYDRVPVLDNYYKVKEMLEQGKATEEEMNEARILLNNAIEYTEKSELPQLIEELSKEENSVLVRERSKSLRGVFNGESSVTIQEGEAVICIIVDCDCARCMRILWVQYRKRIQQNREGDKNLRWEDVKEVARKYNLLTIEGERKIRVPLCKLKKFKENWFNQGRSYITILK